MDVQSRPPSSKPPRPAACSRTACSAAPPRFGGPARSHGVLQLRFPIPHIRRIVQQLDHNEQLTFAVLARETQQLRVRIQDDLEGRLFFFVSDDAARFYGQADLFGAEVSAKFPDARPDIEEAGNCLALGRSTACVLLLMRVLEVGVKTLAEHPKITYVPGHRETMGQVAAAIEQRANALPSTNPHEHEEKAVLQRAAVHYRAVTGAWRNPNMHTTASYTADQARVILDHVGAFMRSLAELL